MVLLSLPCTYIDDTAQGPHVYASRGNYAIGSFQAIGCCPCHFRRTIARCNDAYTLLVDGPTCFKVNQFPFMIIVVLDKGTHDIAWLQITECHAYDKNGRWFSKDLPN